MTGRRERTAACGAFFPIACAMDVPTIEMLAFGRAKTSNPPRGRWPSQRFPTMKTQSIAVVLVLTTGLFAGTGCSNSSGTRVSLDGAAGAAKETGGIGDAEGGGSTGAGGTAGTSGLDAAAGDRDGGGSSGTGGAGPGKLDAGTGDGISDARRDLPVVTGGTVDANRDVATGGQTGTAGTTGTGGSGDTDAGTAQNYCGYECRADSSGVTGWYSGNTLLCTANCLGHKAICSGVGTRSEGCYADEGSAACRSGTGNLIAATTCGELPGDTGYLVWQTQGVGSTGPAVYLQTYVGTGGVLKRYVNTAAFPPETPPLSATTPFDSVTRRQVSDLFSRLQAVNLAALPHAPAATSGCTASLYVRSCTTCAPTTLTYGSAESVTPEMESVWSWFDTVLSASPWANPRNYCAQVGAER